MASSSSPDDGNPSTAADSPPSPFVTTSDVMNQLNRHLSNLSGGGTSSNHQPRFELQKRLPDGSAVPATRDEVEAADFKAKLEQSAKFVAQLATPEDRQYWAEQQRLLGNTFFGRGDYKSAMDIYLTCLVVKESTPNFVNRTLVPILNNLAQCTLQLGMYRKTVLFCDIALQEVRKVNTDGSREGNADTMADENLIAIGFSKVDPIAVCKIYYKLAKAQRLSGNYGEARKALDSSLQCLEQKVEEMDSPSRNSTSDASNSAMMMPYQQAIQKEYRHLDVAEKEARRNHQRQKHAMQNVLSPGGTTAKTSGTTTHGISTSLYDETSGSTRAEPRKFSTLRARKSPTSHLPTTASSSPSKRPNSENSKNSPSRLSIYSQYYWSMVARVTAFLLAVLADEGKDEGKKETDHADVTEDK
jgi:hypothetical protein